MIPLGPVVARNRVGATRAAVWTFIADRERRARWWPELELDARVGGEVAERWSEGEGDSAVSRDAAGRVDVLVDGHALGFTWREAGDERDTAVLLTLRTQGAETGITVTETGFDALPSAADRAAASQEGWAVLLRDLTAAVAEAAAAGEFSAAAIAAYNERIAAAEAEADGETAESSAGGEIAEAEAEESGAEAVSEPSGADAEDADAEDAVAEAETPLDDAEELEADGEDSKSAADTGSSDDAEEAEGEADAEEAPETAADEDEEQGEGEDEDEGTGDPDFDELIRGS